MAKIEESQKLDEIQKRLDFICHKMVQLEKIAGQLFIVLCKVNGIQVKVEKQGEDRKIIIPSLYLKGNING